MAIIGKIRKRSGLLIILIGIAIAGFVLQDAFKGTRGFRNKELGIIDGENITYTEFDKKVEDQVKQVKTQQNKENLTAQEMYQIRQSVWNQFVNDIIMNKEYKNLSIEVSQDEMNDMFYGKFLHQTIVQYFTNQKTGQFDKQRILQIIENFDQLKPEEQLQWKQLEDYIKNDRMRSKYNTLVSKSYYLPKIFAKKSYHAQSDNIQCRLLSVDYNTVSDSSVVLNDKDYQAYYDEHKQEFEQEASRDIDYVVFEVKPSKEDFDNITKAVDNNYAEFQTVDKERIPEFVNSISETKFDSLFIKKGKLPYAVDSLVFNSQPGTFIPPFIDNNAYKMAKILDVQMRPDSLKASHILIAFKGAYGANEKIIRSKEEAQKLADSLKQVLQKDPAKFADIAFAMSDDQSAKENKGDLKWFADQTMVAPFNEAVLKGKVGDITIAESIFGIHVINITGKTTPEKKVKFALITIGIEPSNQTFKNVFAQANKFASENNTQEIFENAIKRQGLNKRTAEYIQPMSDNIPGVENARELVRWAFNEDVKKGEVSKQVFEFEDKFIIAVLKEIREKGIATLEQIKPRLEFVVKRDKKAVVIQDRLNKVLSQTKDLYQLANQFNTKVDTVEQLNFASYNIGRKGYEPEVIGTAFSLKENVISKPIKGYSGVYIVNIDKIITAPETKDYTNVILQMQNMYQQRVSNDVFRVLQDKTKITDNRILFY